MPRKEDSKISRIYMKRIVLKHSLTGNVKNKKQTMIAMIIIIIIILLIITIKIELNGIKLIFFFFCNIQITLYFSNITYFKI